MAISTLWIQTVLNATWARRAGMIPYLPRSAWVEGAASPPDQVVQSAVNLGQPVDKDRPPELKGQEKGQ